MLVTELVLSETQCTLVLLPGEEDGGWMLSAYCGTDVLKKEFFYTLDRNSVSKPPERYNTVEQQSVFVSGSTQTPASSTLENKSLGTPTDSSGCDSDRSAQASATARPLTIRKRTASYAFVSSEPESNNNKSQYDDAYEIVATPKLPRLSSAETNEETAPQDTSTYEDKDYIYENPYLIEYRDYNGESEIHEQNHEEELFNFNQVGSKYKLTRGIAFKTCLHVMFFSPCYCNRPNVTLCQW